MASNSDFNHLRMSSQNTRTNLALLSNNGVASHGAFSKSVTNFNSVAPKSNSRLYSSGNPLKMIKEYKTKQSQQEAKGSISFKSNASTKEYQIEENERQNYIMNEPIENLIANMSHLSRPMSSNLPFASNKDYSSNRVGVGSSHAYSRKRIG